MELFQIIVFVICSALIGLLARERKPTVFLLALSVWAIFWLQPKLQITNLDFWLPFATLTITFLSWVFVASAAKFSWRENWKSAFVIIFVVILWALFPYLRIPVVFALPTQPMLVQALMGLGIIVLAAGLFARVSRPVLLWGVLLTILALFVIIKTPPLVVEVGTFLREWTRQSGEPASTFDIRWLGFSYIAFRIIRTIRDSQSGILPSVTLEEYVTYVIFFPALSAGPIDKIERFVQDIRTPLSLSDADWLYAGQRILFGLFKKFVLADGLALLAFNSADSISVQPGGWAWMVLYAYSFQIFFDFSGYTDIAIGIARLVGVRLPENFAAPFLKPNLTQFWNSWHMTLTQWFRSYYFNPFTRFLRTLKRPLPIWLIIMLTQISTMVLIGLWHGVALNFVIWGLWQGLGLFIHNRWSEYTRDRAAGWASTPWRASLLNFFGIFLTFNFMSMGWMFFSTSSIPLMWNFLSKLVFWSG